MADNHSMLRYVSHTADMMRYMYQETTLLRPTRPRVSEVTLVKALRYQQGVIATRGGTLDGYNKYFRPKTLTEYVRTRKRYEADMAFLAVLVRAGLLEHTGHPVDIQTIVHNQRFFEKVAMGEYA